MNPEVIQDIPDKYLKCSKCMVGKKSTDQVPINDSTVQQRNEAG
jgi:hypothetical protein